jgi:hypothetical protein
MLATILMLVALANANEYDYTYYLDNYKPDITIIDVFRNEDVKITCFGSKFDPNYSTEDERSTFYIPRMEMMSSISNFWNTEIDDDAIRLSLSFRCKIENSYTGMERKYLYKLKLTINDSRPICEHYFTRISNRHLNKYFSCKAVYMPTKFYTFRLKATPNPKPRMSKFNITNITEISAMHESVVTFECPKSDLAMVRISKINNGSIIKLAEECESVDDEFIDSVRGMRNNICVYKLKPTINKMYNGVFVCHIGDIALKSYMLIYKRTPAMLLSSAYGAEKNLEQIRPLKSKTGGSAAGGSAAGGSGAGNSGVSGSSAFSSLTAGSSADLRFDLEPGNSSAKQQSSSRGSVASQPLLLIILCIIIDTI